MERELLSLGIDTSNYKTSLAVVDKTGEVLFNYQKFLDVKPGEKGLRQSEAFFQHVQKLPEPAAPGDTGRREACRSLRCYFLPAAPGLL